MVFKLWILTIFTLLSHVSTPGLVAAFVMKKPEEVAITVSKREFTPVALYVPIIPVLVLLGMLLLYITKPEMLQKEDPEADEEEGETPAGETTGLLPKDARGGRRRSSIVVGSTITPTTEMGTRTSTQMMGIPNLDTQLDKDVRVSLWEHLGLDEDLVNSLTDDDFN